MPFTPIVIVLVAISVVGQSRSLLGIRNSWTGLLHSSCHSVLSPDVISGADGMREGFDKAHLYHYKVSL